MLPPLIRIASRINVILTGTFLAVSFAISQWWGLAVHLSSVHVSSQAALVDLRSSTLQRLDL
jgi:hypothetical protein